MTNNTKPIIDGKSFFDYPEKEKKEIITEAAKEANEAQREFMEGQHTENSVPWEDEFDKEFVWNDKKGYTFVNESGKQRVKAFIKAQIATAVQEERKRIVLCRSNPARSCESRYCKIL